jgi:hypothetical protein
MRKDIIARLLLVLLLTGAAEATPSTQIWNPSTDLQAQGRWHFGIDNYFTVNGPASGGYAFPTDTGLTYGLTDNIEIGIDIFLPQSSPFVFNAKYAMPESKELPAVAIGGFGFGTEKGVTDQNVIYVIAAKTLPVGRFSGGGFIGNDKVLLDQNGNKDNTGFIMTWDKALSEKIWVCVDYCSSRSALGSLFAGVSYLFSPNTSVIFGYGSYNNGAKPTATLQLDINI